MRKAALAILTMATIWTAAPARAQTYDPAYPICLHVFGREVEYYECTYTSLDQCKQTASGRQAMCVVNPYYAGRETGNGRRPRRGY
jgi:hypothetical protein